MDKSITFRQEKWERYARGIDTKSASKRATFALTAEHALALMGDRREGLLLDIGCGFGEIDMLLSTKSNFKIIGCDISRECVRRAKENISEARMEQRISIEVGDVYNLPYPDSFFDIVVSFGYTSAATYKGAQSEVARVLKPGGLLVCDFINLLSVYKIISAILRRKRLLNEEGKHYNILTARGIEEYFGKYGLQFVSQRLFNSYPPCNFLPIDSLILFDKTIGRAFNKILGRVRLVCFEKK